MDDLAERIVSGVRDHPAVRSIRLIGSRAEGRATEVSDWDFRVEAHDFEALAGALPRLCGPLDPLAQQWDRLSAKQCWMLILRGPAKVDLIFPDEPHAHEPPWKPNRENLDDIDGHFWDWMLWLRGKEAGGKDDLVERELGKLLDHLLAPLGVKQHPASIAQAITSYREARLRAERRFGVSVRRELETAVAPAFSSERATAPFANPS
jgi:hypothetical protein